LKTTDGGTTWITRNSGTTENLSSVNFPDSNTGYAVGGNSWDPLGIIRKTINGGGVGLDETHMHAIKLKFTQTLPAATLRSKPPPRGTSPSSTSTAGNSSSAK